MRVAESVSSAQSKEWWYRPHALLTLHLGVQISSALLGARLPGGTSATSTSSGAPGSASTTTSTTSSSSPSASNGTSGSGGGDSGRGLSHSCASGVDNYFDSEGLLCKTTEGR